MISQPRKESKMKNTNQRASSGQWPGFLVYMLSGAACALVFMHSMTVRGQTDTLLPLLLMIPFLLASMVIQTILHEGGHLLFGALTGYRFISFRIFQFMWVMEKGKLRFRRMHLAGTAGQCRMGPPDLKNGTIPFRLYNYGGAILNLASAIVFLALSFLCAPASLLRVFLLFLTIMGVSFALLNGLPLPSGDVTNDGQNVQDMSRHPEAVRAFWISMKVNEALSKGMRTRDMPAEWFTVPSPDAMNSPLTAFLGALACSRLMDEEKFQEADALMERTLSEASGLTGLHRGLMVCDRMYLEAIGENRPEQLKALRSKEQEKIIKSMASYPSVLRTQYACALLSDREPEKAAEFRRQFEKAAVVYPFPQEIESERALIALADEKAGRPGAQTEQEG